MMLVYVREEFHICLPPMHPNGPLRLDILENLDAVLRGAVDRRHEIARLIGPETGSVSVLHSESCTIPDRNEGQIEGTHDVTNLFELWTYRNLLFVLAVTDSPICGVAT